MSLRIITSDLLPDDKVYLVNTDLPELKFDVTSEFEIDSPALYDRLRFRQEIRASFDWGEPIYESDPFDETIYLHSWADVRRLVRQLIAGVGYEFRKASGRPRIVGRMNARAFGVLSDIS